MKRSKKDGTPAIRERTTGALSRELAGMVRTIAAHERVSMPEIMDRLARGAVVREYKRVLAEMQAQIDSQGD